MNKYNVTPTVIDGVRFASKKEGNRYLELKQLTQAGVISDLELQPKFSCVVNDHLVCNYIADFRYKENGGGQVVEDVKGYKKGGAYAHYRTKVKLVKALYGVEVIEI